MPRIETQIASILQDRNTDKPEKVARLRQLEADARARERGATEGLAPVRGNDGEDLKAIEQALLQLGEPALDPGAATL